MWEIGRSERSGGVSCGRSEMWEIGRILNPPDLPRDVGGREE